MTGEPTALEIADVLDRAHDELLVRGWGKGRLESFSGKVCSVGAVLYACEFSPRQWGQGRPVPFRALRTIEMLARAVGRTRQAQLEEWNDDDLRIEDDVFDLFRSTAKRLREEAQ